MSTIILLISFLTCLPGQELTALPQTKNPVAPKSIPAPFKCSQPAAEQDPLIREAVQNQYWVRRVEFMGNEYTRDYVLRSRIMFQEGDIFRREKLVKSLAGLNRLKKIIYPVTLSDVIIRLDRPDKLVDMTICLKEKRKIRG